MMRIKKLIRNMGFWLSRKINYPLIPPDTLQISPTNRCNLRCKMCNIWQKPNKDNELSFYEIKDVIDQSIKWGIEEINLCGGEPLLSSNCFKIIDYAKDNKIKVTLTTNGTLIDRVMAKRLIETGLDIISISLDGVTAEVHDKIRGQNGAYNKIIQGIEFLNQYSSHLIKVLTLTISNDNLDELLDYVYLAKRLSIDSIYLTSLVLDNVRLYSQDIESSQWISGERLKKLDEIFNRIKLLQEEYYQFDYPSFQLISKYFRRELREDDWVCFAGFRRFVLCPDGNIQMCGETIGNIKEEKNIRRIWVSSQAKIKRIKIKQCRNYCLQDCHARQESANFKDILRYSFKM